MSDGRQPHILIVNDTREILDLLRELLKGEGFRVTTSMATLDLGKVKELAPAAIIQGLLFEHEQVVGWTFLTRVRLDPELARIPLILCTAVHTVKEPEMVSQLEHLGVRVVLKPFDIDELLATLNEALAERGSHAACQSAR